MLRRRTATCSLAVTGFPSCPQLQKSQLSSAFVGTASRQGEGWTLSTSALGPRGVSSSVAELVRRCSGTAARRILSCNRRVASEWYKSWSSRPSRLGDPATLTRLFTGARRGLRSRTGHGRHQRCRLAVTLECCRKRLPTSGSMLTSSDATKTMGALSGHRHHRMKSAIAREHSAPRRCRPHSNPLLRPSLGVTYSG